MHQEAKNFTCKYCKVEFRHNNSLKRHMMQHTGERPYACAHCSMAFTGRSVSRIGVKYTVQREWCKTNGARFLLAPSYCSALLPKYIASKH